MLDGFTVGGLAEESEQKAEEDEAEHVGDPGAPGMGVAESGDSSPRMPGQDWDLLHSMLDSLADAVSGLLNRQAEPDQLAIFDEFEAKLR
eukprot:11355001-Alexandrium_andersonii.AAC.1